MPDGAHKCYYLVELQIGCLAPTSAGIIFDLEAQRIAVVN